MRKEEFENAFQFLAGYFHQDFSVEFGEPEVAVRKYIEDSNASTRVTVVRELREVIAKTEDSQLDDAVFELGCYYSPQRHRGVAMRAWLVQVIDEIEHSMSQAK